MAPLPVPSWPFPEFSLIVDELDHTGTNIFFAAVPDLLAVLRDAVSASFTHLYTQSQFPTNVKSILLILLPMPGVAHTTGSRTHKEIYFSLDYIANLKVDTNPPSSTSTTLPHPPAPSKLPENINNAPIPPSRARDEIRGVLTHEVVHCYQYDADGTCPGGLIEGFADYVRLRAGLVPPHWKRTGGDRWDAGYAQTAYFLDWLETRYGSGTIVELNDALKPEKKADDEQGNVRGQVTPTPVVGKPEAALTLSALLPPHLKPKMAYQLSPFTPGAPKPVRSASPTPTHLTPPRPDSPTIKSNPSLPTAVLPTAKSTFKRITSKFDPPKPTTSNVTTASTPTTLKYHRRIFRIITGRPVRKLWKMYCKELADRGEWRPPKGFGKTKAEMGYAPVYIVGGSGARKGVSGM